MTIHDFYLMGFESGKNGQEQQIDATWSKQKQNAYRDGWLAGRREWDAQPAQKEARRLNMISFYMRRCKENAEENAAEVKAEVIARIEKYGVIDACDWMTSYAEKACEAAWYAEIQRFLNMDTFAKSTDAAPGSPERFVAVIAAIADQIQERLLGSYDSLSSSSAFSNATTYAKITAQKSVLRDLRFWQQSIAYENQ